MGKSEGRSEWRERVRRRGKRDLRFMRLEITSFPKTESPLYSKLLKMKKKKKNNDNHQKEGTKQK